MLRGDGMSYRIIYGEENQKLKSASRFIRLQFFTAVFFLMMILLSKFLWKDSIEILKAVFLPQSVTFIQEAFSELLSGIEAGESASVMLETFCRTVIDNAQIHSH